MASTKPFNNDWISAPGDTISEIINERGITISNFSNALELTVSETADLLEGRLAITIAIARKLAKELGASVEFWMAREGQYRDDISRLSAVHKDWLKELPIKEMVQYQWLKPLQDQTLGLAACLRFFNVPSISVWSNTYKELSAHYAFRTSPSVSSKPAPVTAWLRQGEIEAESVICSPWNKDMFEASLPAIRSLTHIKNPRQFLPKLQEICAKSGVAVVVVRAPKGCPASGATRFVSEKKAILQLSFRYLVEDQFWFSFFHEAAHLLLHGEKGFFIEGGKEPLRSREEVEANEFAANVLVPSVYRTDLSRLRQDAHEIIKFSVRVGVSPGIIVGQLEHLHVIPFGKMNRLKRRYKWQE